MACVFVNNCSFSFNHSVFDCLTLIFNCLLSFGVCVCFNNNSSSAVSLSLIVYKNHFILFSSSPFFTFPHVIATFPFPPDLLGKVTGFSISTIRHVVCVSVMPMVSLWMVVSDIFKFEWFAFECNCANFSKSHIQNNCPINKLSQPKNTAKIS